MVVVKIMVPFRVLSIIRHLVFRGSNKKDNYFDNHPNIVHRSRFTKSAAVEH